MTITVETGAGLSDADAYISVADADAYFLKRGNETWVDTDSDLKEQAIVRATFALDSKYRGLWRGVKGSATQALAWPRIKELDSIEGITDEEGYELAIDALPTRLKYACAEVALIELTARFVPEAADRSNMVKSESIGPISTTYMDSAPSNTVYPHIDMLLDGLTTGSAGGIGMVIGLTDAERDQDTEFDPFSYPEYFTLIKYL